MLLVIWIKQSFDTNYLHTGPGMGDYATLPKHLWWLSKTSHPAKFLGHCNVSRRLLCQMSCLFDPFKLSRFMSAYPNAERHPGVQVLPKDSLTCIKISSLWSDNQLLKPWIVICHVLTFCKQPHINYISFCWIIRLICPPLWHIYTASVCHL